MKGEQYLTQPCNLWASMQTFREMPVMLQKWTHYFLLLHVLVSHPVPWKPCVPGANASLTMPTDAPSNDNTGRPAMVLDRPWRHQEHLGWKESLSETGFPVCTSGAGDQDLNIHVNFNWYWDIFRIHFPNCIKPHSIFMTKIKKKIL